jgi:exodeoxyribonuclease V beta subunit
MERFSLLDPLPQRGTTLVLEASAGTGKTFTLAGLVTRYVADGAATLDQMLLITFSRAASRELRERVRGQLRDAAVAFNDAQWSGDNQVIRYLLDGSGAQRAERRARLVDALANFDAATIATTHEFCHLVLKSLGVAGDSDAGVTLVEDLDELVVEIVDDLYLQNFGRRAAPRGFTLEAARRLARDVVNNPGTRLSPADPPQGSDAFVRLCFAHQVLAVLDQRKRRQGVLGYDDLLTRLADALADEDSPARLRMRERWPIVMVDEFQDTDLVQWEVVSRAFREHSTLILIGDPKQAIYAFRGGDIVTYLRAAATAGERRTLGTNWRSDAPLVQSLQTVLRGAALGDEEIVVRDVDVHHREHRLAGAPHNAPFRLRVVRRADFGVSGTDIIRIEDLRAHITADLAADIALLLSSGATLAGEPLCARDIAVIVERHRDGDLCREALAAAGVAAVTTGGVDVFASQAAKDWLCLLEAFDQPHRNGLVRAAAATMFFGETAASLAAGGEALTERIAETLRLWADFARQRGMAAVFEAAQLAGMGQRVLSWRGGERNMTDLAHVGELLHETAHREGYGLPALRDWLRRQCAEQRTDDIERSRRLDSDAAAVPIMTVWGAKGLQFPIVYLPFAFNRYVKTADLVLFHDDSGARSLYIGGGGRSPELTDAQRRNRVEEAGDNARQTYVALTRAQSQVVAWWAPSRDERNGGLSRLLRGRRPGEVLVPERCSNDITDKDALACFQAWHSAGGPVVEESVVAGGGFAPGEEPPDELGVRLFERSIDTAWRRTSYSGLIRAADIPAVSSEQEVVGLDDEIADILVGSASGSGAEVVSPMSALPTGTTFGSLVHAVLENADPLASDLASELEAWVREFSVWWPVGVPDGELAAALIPMHDTPLGPLARGLTLRGIGLRDRLRELDFEIPLAGGDRGGSASDVSLVDVGRLLGEYLADDDPLAPYAARLSSAALDRQPLRGYLSGAIDAVLRIPDGTGHRYVVVDYKTNRLGDPDRVLTAADYARPQLVSAMLHSDYPLQALLYSVVLHRFLRWRVAEYDPGRHLGGVLYLFVRGMCGPDTPVVDGHPAGVFSWRPPVELVVALSDLLAGERRAA